MSGLIDVEYASAAAPEVARGYRLEERLAGDAGRTTLERFVAERFERVHGAKVRSFMPALIGLTDWKGTLRCALGYRGAAAGPLFLEQYLDAPIERAIEHALVLRDGATPAIERSAVVEVGNLAGRGCRAAMYLVAQLPRFLIGRGYAWITFTATDRVREILATLDAPLVDLGPADPSRLQRADDDWGDYYRTRPHVLAGWLPSGLGFAR